MNNIELTSIVSAFGQGDIIAFHTIFSRIDTYIDITFT